jgi:hypothetical protein
LCDLGKSYRMLSVNEQKPLNTSLHFNQNPINIKL